MKTWQIVLMTALVFMLILLGLAYKGQGEIINACALELQKRQNE